MNPSRITSVRATESPSAMRLIRFLDREGIPFKWFRDATPPTDPPPAPADEKPFSSQCVAKTIVVKNPGELLLCVVPQDHEIDLRLVADVLGVQSVQLADQNDLATLFKDCQPGAEPPFGNLYGIKTLMDDRIEDNEYILCKACTHGNVVRFRSSDYEKLVCPIVARIARPPG